MKVTVLEVPARFGAFDAQVRWVDEALWREPPGDLVVLPEACLTGYVSPTGHFDLTPFAEPLEGRQLEALRSLAQRHRTAVLGPIIERSGPHCFNTAVVVDAAGTLLAQYRKRHPWYPETWATPGDLEFPRFEIGGVRATLAICFDVHFLEAEAAPVLESVDVLFFQSAWVDDEGDSRPGHLARLVSRFGVTIVNANWGPGSPRLAGQGGSMVMARAGMQRRLSEGEARFTWEVGPRG